MESEAGWNLRPYKQIYTHIELLQCVYFSVHVYLFHLSRHLVTADCWWYCNHRASTLLWISHNPSREKKI
jgi:hypothetical protein